jgi:hypothetical protein
MSDWWSADPIAGGAAPADGVNPQTGRLRITVRPPPRYADAISSVESGGRYDALGPVTRTGDRAYGKYQVMGANVGPWTREVLGRELTPQEFAASPSAQDAVFKAKFGGYVKKYGPEGAARAWFAGEGGMNDPGRKDILGTTVEGYAGKFNKAMGFAPEEAPQFPPAKDATPVPVKTGGEWWTSDPPAQAPAAQPEKPVQFGPERPAKGKAESFGRGAAQGATANFYDELRGLMEAGGLNPTDPASLSALIQGAYKYWTGDPEAAKRYQTAADRERAANAQAAADNPVTSLAGNVGGAVALPVGVALQAATLPVRMARGAAAGAGYGGLSGAGEGVGAADSAARAATGTVLGGIVGGVAPPIVEGAIQGGAALIRPVATAIRGARNPENEAARRVVTAIQRDVRIDPAAEGRLTPGEFAASAQQGGPATIMDIGGETTRGLARSAANTSPEGRAALNRTINDRFEGQGNRIVTWLNDTFNFPNARAQQEAIRTTAQQVNHPAYQRAMQDGSQGVWDAELQRLAGAPAIQEAARGAIPSLANRGISEGFRAPRQNPITTNPDTGLAQLTTLPNGNTRVPDLRFWDQVKKNIDAQISKADRYGDRAKVQELTALNSDLVANLDRIVPSYAQARAGAAHFFGAENALEAGQNFVRANLGNAEARRALAQMSQTERQLFQDGFVSRYIETLNATGDRRNVLNQIANTAEAREKLSLVLGPQRSAELEAGLRVEGIMDLARNAVQGNSTTARQLAELGFAGGAGSLGAYGAYNMDPAQMTYAAVAGALLAGKKGIDQRVAQRVAEMLVSNNPQSLLRGIRLVARNGRFMESLRIADRKIASAGGQQTPIGLPAVQSMATSRAESDQPEVPRPPRQ